MSPEPRGPAPAEGRPAPKKWWSPAPDPVLPPIGARRAYTEVILVYLAFFVVAIILAGLLLADRYHDNTAGASWAVYMANAVEVVTQIGLAVAVVFLLASRRGVTAAALGISIPRKEDGRIAVSRSIRICGWAFFAIILGGIVNAALQTGHLPTHHASAPELIFSAFDSLQAGIIEELVVLAFVVVTLRQAGRPWWEVLTVALVLRGAYHVYYGPGVFGILVWAALFFWIYVRFRQLVLLMVCHALWDVVAFLSQATVVVVYVGELCIVGLWIVCGILWLIERNNTPAAVAGYSGGPGYGTYGAGGWASGGGWTEAGGGGWAGGGERAGGGGAGAGGGAYGGGGGYGGGWAGWQGNGHGGSPAPAQAQAGGPVQPPAPGNAQPAGGPPPAPVPAPASSPGPPPGWHPDPAGHNRWRWWDGHRWTEHVSPPG